MILKARFAIHKNKILKGAACVSPEAKQSNGRTEDLHRYRLEVVLCVRRMHRQGARSSCNEFDDSRREPYRQDHLPCRFSFIENLWDWRQMPPFELKQK